MVAGFVGGGDVFSTGEGAKGQVAGTLKKGTIGAFGAGAGFLGATTLLPALTARGIHRRRASKKVQTRLKDQEVLSNYNKQREKTQKEIDSGSWKNNDDFIRTQIATDSNVRQLYQNAYSFAQGTNEQKEAYAKARVAEFMDHDDKYKQRYRDRRMSGVSDELTLRRFDSKSSLYRKTSRGRRKLDEELSTDEDIANFTEKFERKTGKKIERNYLDKDGTTSAKGAFAMMWNTFAQTMGSAKLFIKNVAGELNIDK